MDHDGFRGRSREGRVTEDRLVARTKLLCCGGKGGAPPAPDYAGAAREQQRGQMTSQYTPYGSQVYYADGNSPSGYQSQITLAPEAQKTLDTQMALSGGLANIANTQLPGLQQHFSQPMDQSSVQDTADASYALQTQRLDPQWAARDTQQETKLINQGLRPGDEAYTNAMRDYNSARNDAYSQARLNAINTMPQTYQLASAQYQQPLNVFNALRTGAQIQNPQFSQQPGAPYFNAAQAAGNYGLQTYGIDVGAQNNFMNGLFGLGAAGILGWGR